jgi:hypothetical protein
VATTATPRAAAPDVLELQVDPRDSKPLTERYRLRPAEAHLDPVAPPLDLPPYVAAGLAAAALHTLP